MAKNVEGARFVSKGIEYVLQHGPKGNLRPYTVGPVAAASAKAAVRIPVWGWVVAGTILAGAVSVSAYRYCTQRG